LRRCKVHDSPPFYAGIDPGFSGGIALMNAAGTMAKVWDMPITRGKDDRDRQREIDLGGLRVLFSTLCRMPKCVVGIEWPTTRPGEGAERSERFGRGKGYLEAFAFLKGLQYRKLAPSLWKGRLGLPGKDHPQANEKGAALFESHYPECASLIRGPRGGILDGRLDALLIAHAMRTGILVAKFSELVEYGKKQRKHART
jgi:hypothetical protein